MNIFISQSGDLSRKIAEIFNEWIKSYFNNAEVFVSSTTIDGGKAWFENVLENLRNSDFAISILTKENHSKPWINYEYGALVEILRNKGMDNSKIVPILFGFGPEELSGEPISQYQCIKLEEKEKVKKIFLDINKLNKENKISDRTFIKKFETTYEEYKTKIDSLIKPKVPTAEDWDRFSKKLEEEMNPKKSKLDDYSSLINPSFKLF